ncbi:MAG TPA: bifunctional nuclease domain-containing protein [Candidatus Binatia bacterium]
MKSRTLLLVFFLCARAGLLGAGQEEPSVEMTVKNLMLDPFTQSPVVLLESAKEKKSLPIWIGAEEATSIALEIKKVAMPRPNTHDLIRNILRGVGGTIQRITITDLRNDVYYATIALRLKGQEYQIDSRPSDAIAVALRMKAPIYAAAKVLARAKPIGPLEKTQSEMQRTLGIQTQDLTPDLAGLFDLKTNGGILVADVELGGPASAAGLQRGDVILRVDEKSLQKTSELESFLQSAKKGAQLKIEVMRKGKSITVAVNLP